MPVVQAGGGRRLAPETEIAEDGTAVGSTDRREPPSKEPVRSGAVPSNTRGSHHHSQKGSPPRGRSRSRSRRRATTVGAQRSRSAQLPQLPHLLLNPDGSLVEPSEPQPREPPLRQRATAAAVRSFPEMQLASKAVDMTATAGTAEVVSSSKAGAGRKGSPSPSRAASTGFSADRHESPGVRQALHAVAYQTPFAPAASPLAPEHPLRMLSAMALAPPTSPPAMAPPLRPAAPLPAQEEPEAPVCAPSHSSTAPSSTVPQPQQERAEVGSAKASGAPGGGNTLFDLLRMGDKSTAAPAPASAPAPAPPPPPAPAPLTERDLAAAVAIAAELAKRTKADSQPEGGGRGKERGRSDGSRSGGGRKRRRSRSGRSGGHGRRRRRSESGGGRRGRRDRGR